MSLVVRHPDCIRIAIQLLQVRHLRVIHVRVTGTRRYVVPFEIRFTQIKRIAVGFLVVHRVVRNQDRLTRGYTIRISIARNTVHRVYGKIPIPKIMVSQIVFLHRVQIGFH